MLLEPCELVLMASGTRHVTNESDVLADIEEWLWSGRSRRWGTASHQGSRKQEETVPSHATRNARGFGAFRECPSEFCPELPVRTDPHMTTRIQYTSVGTSALLFCALALGGLSRNAEARQLFVERAIQAGLADAVHSTGLAVADYDLDGDLDLFVVSAKEHDQSDPGTWNRLYRNNGDDTFSDVTDAAGVRGVADTGFTSYMGNQFGASWADFDNDGDPDLLLTRIGPEVLYMNNGDGTFTDVSAGSGINPGNAAVDTLESSGATWWDFNRDGHLDLYVSNWHGANQLYRATGSGTFDEVGVQLAVADTGRTWTAMPQDFDHDGWTDLYLANDFGPNRLYLNRNGEGFVDATLDFRMGDAGHGMGLAVGDINGDLLPDVYVTNISFLFPNVMYAAVPSPPYEEVAEFLGLDNADWGWGAEFFDADLDGDVDLYAVNGFVIENDTPNRFWRNSLIPSGATTFTEVSASWGTDDRAEARGLVVFDYDNDGDLDMAVATWDDRVRLFQNTGGSGNWLSYKLRGRQLTDAQGAVVTVLAGGKRQIRVNDGVDIFGQSLTPIHFGIGLSVVADSVTVRWPSGNIDTWTNLSANQMVSLSEGTGTAITPDPPSRPVVVAVYPNPTKGLLSLALPRVSARHRLLVTDILGREAEVSRVAEAAFSLTVDVSRLAPGVYYYRYGRYTGTFVKR
jgi:hypothetical protein